MVGMSFDVLISDTHSLLPELIKIKHARQNDVIVHHLRGYSFFKESLGTSHTISLSVKDD